MESFPQNSNENQTPFKNKLTKSDISEPHRELGKFYELKNNPDKIIRIISFDSIKKDFGDQTDPIVLAGLGKKLYKELETNYDIATPVDYVIGKDENGREVVYGITDKITSNVLTGNEATPELARQVEKPYTSLSQYYLDKSDKLSKGESYLTDIAHISQYAYGKKMDDERLSLYLIDTDLYVRNDKVSFYYVVAWLSRHISAIEEKLEKHFDVARKNIEKIIAHPNLDDLSIEEKESVKTALVEANNFLAGKFSEESDNLPTGIFPLT